MKRIKSTDPRKEGIVRLLKAFALSGGVQADKLTCIREDSNGEFVARAFKSLGGRKYEYLGEVMVNPNWMDALKNVTYNPDFIKEQK